MSDEIHTTPEPSPVGPTAGEVLALIARMPVRERRRLLRELERDPSLHTTGVVVISRRLFRLMLRVSGLLRDEMHLFADLFGEADSALSRRNRKPSREIAQRNAEIVRLRDIEGVSFKKIPRRLLDINPDWCSKGKGPLPRDTVEKAYHRTKNSNGRAHR
jgi:hypothetical protein